MKRFLVLLALISLGLNVGLWVRLSSEQTRSAPGCIPSEPHSVLHERGKPSDRHPEKGERGAFRRGIVDKRLEYVIKQLGLDNDKASEFKEIHGKAIEGFKEQRQTIVKAQKTLVEAAGQPGFEISIIRPLIAEVGRQQAKLDSMVTETMLQELEILDDEQRSRYMEILPFGTLNGRRGGKGLRSGHLKRQMKGHSPESN